MPIFRIVRDEKACLQIIPDRSVRNYRVHDLAKAVAEMYRSPLDRFIFSLRGLSYLAPDTVTWETVYTREAVTYHLIVPRRLIEFYRRKAESIWERATIQEAPLPAVPAAPRAEAAELHYKRHDLLSMAHDARVNEPLPSLLTAAATMEAGDRAMVQAVLEPVNRLEWEMEATRTFERLMRGTMPHRAGLTAKMVGHQVGVLISAAFREAFDFLREFISETPPSAFRKPVVFDPEARLQLAKGLSDPGKGAAAVLRTFVRIAAESDNAARATMLVHGLAAAYKDIAADNELDRRDILRGKARFFREMTERRPPIIRINGNMMSVKEVGQLMKLPTADLQRDFPRVASITRKEVHLPAELFREDVRGIPLGYVTEKGDTRLARIPAEGFDQAKQKHVYDALCTPSFIQGKMGSGKTDGAGANWAMGFIVNGFTAICIDTADGQGLRNLEDALPSDYPEEKLIHIDLDNKAWPIALNWSDVLGREPAAGADGELAAVEIAEKMTARFKEFVAGMATTEFSDRMEQYLCSAMRAVTTRPGWSFLDVELALKSPAYRQELLQDPAIRETMPSVVDDLTTLQEKAAAGSAGSIVEPILSRLKVMTNSRFMENLFYQPAMVDAAGRPALDFRKWLDNDAGGFGYCVCIHASADAWGDDGIALVLGFMEDKINFNVFSRVDQDQDRRRPALSWIDEPHKVIKTTARYYANANVEFRKYRCKRLFTGHSIDQMGAAAKSLLEGGAQITSYKTESLADLEKFGHIFAPYESAEEIYDQLPDKWVAINRVRLASNTDCPAFIAAMMPPPAAVKSRAARRATCARQFGRGWKEVSEEIVGRRRHYQRLDEEWYAAIEEEEREAKRAERERRREEKKAAAAAE